MRILVFNAGSSSVKFGVFEGGEHVFKHSLDGLEHVEPALEKVPGLLKENGYEDFDGIGHRIAHGGEAFLEARLIDGQVMSAIGKRRRRVGIVLWHIDVAHLQALRCSSSSLSTVIGNVC